MTLVLNLTLAALLAIALIPLYRAWRSEDIWLTLTAFASFASKTSILILVFSVLRDDWMLGVVGVIILGVGNAGIMLLAQILRRLEGES